MYTWRNNKIKNQYDLQMMTAKNKGVQSFTSEELSVTNLKSKAFQDIKDPKTKRLIELAYTLGRLDGLLTADSQLDEVPFSKQASDAILKKSNAAPVVPQEELLYFLVCKVKNRQDKTVYTNLSIKARSESEAMTFANTECGMKNQTLIEGKIVKTYGPDTMQYQFGIGTKDQTTLMELGKKMLK